MSRATHATVSVALLFLFLTGCFGGDGNVTQTGKGIPIVTADFPATVAAGSTNTLEVTVENPGPGDIRTLAIAFALVGPKAGDSGFPNALITLGTQGKNPSIVTVSPSPKGTSPDGVVYTFEGIAEGETATFRFEVKAPDEPGVAANSVQAYDGQEIDRAGGVRVETTVER